MLNLFKFHRSFFQKSSCGKSGRTNTTPTQRRLRLESLETRALLSVTPGDYAQLRAQYPELGLDDFTELNTIEIEADGLSIANLKAAIASAEATEGDDLIVVRTTDDANTIKYTDTNDTLSINYNSTYSGSVIIATLGPKPLTLDADQLTDVAAIGEGDVRLAGLTFANGLAPHTAGGFWNDAELTLVDVMFSGNASKTCGAIYNLGTITASRTSFVGNSGQVYGGCFANFGVFTLTDCFISENAGSDCVFNGGTMTMTNCVVSGNTASSGGGGIDNSGNATLTNCVVSENAAKYGGGIYNTGTLETFNCAVVGNYATDSGGGICNNGSLTTHDTTIDENRSETYGGGIYHYSGSALKLNGGSIDNNSAVNMGGGIYSMFSDGNLTGVSISSNYATSSGGGICSIYGGDWTLTKCLVKENEANTGGGIGYWNDVSYTMIDVDLVGNRAEMGAGIYVGGSDSLSMTDCKIVKNVACMEPDGYIVNVEGGGIYCGAGTVAFERCLFSENVSKLSENTPKDWISYASGGAFFSYGDATFSNCQFEKNVSRNGGALYSVWGTLVCTDCSFTENSAGADGGAIYNGSDTTLTRCVFTDNNAAFWGGAIMNCETDNIYNCVFSGNEADERGGALFDFGGATLFNCVVSGNYSGQYGGGFFGAGDSTLINCVVTGNTAGFEGGGYCQEYYEGQAFLYNSIVAQNNVVDARYIVADTEAEIEFDFDGERALDFCGELALESSNNLIGVASGFVVAPEFDEKGFLSNGDKLDLHLRDDSMAIDAGENSYVPEEVATDLDGSVRIYNRTVDIGAYESTYYVSLETPANVSIKADVYSLVVSYDAVESATKYVVAYSTDPNFATYETVESTDVSCELGGLLSNTTYYVQVKATGGDFADSKWSNVVSGKTFNDAVMPPTLTKVASPTESSLLVTFSDDYFESGVSSYCIEYSTDAEFSTTVGSKTFNQPGLGKIKGLASDTTYYFRVQTITADGESAWSKAVPGTTLEAKVDPVTTPILKKIASPTETSLLVTFSDDAFVEGVASYSVEYSTDANFLTNVGSKTFKQPGVGKINKLEPGTTYFFRVKSIGSDGDFEWSNVLSGTTSGTKIDPVTTPILKKVASPTENYLLVTFSDDAFVEGVASYCVEYSTDRDFLTNVGSKTFKQPGLGKINKLEPGTTYHFRVKSIGPDGDSEWSNVLSGTTLG